MPYLDIPFAFMGHSMGATLGFEIARQLRRQNAPQPLHLFVCSCPAPQTPLIGPQIHQLPEAAFIAELCHRYNAIPLAIATDKALMQLFLPSLRADLIPMFIPAIAHLTAPSQHLGDYRMEPLNGVT